jgi:hypothetical protein
MSEVIATREALARRVSPMADLTARRFGLDEIGDGIDAALSREPGYIKGIVVPD